MTKRDTFKIAHEMTRSIVKAGDDYRATFGMALAYISRIAKAAAAHGAEVKVWRSGNAARVYINFSSHNRFRPEADCVDLRTGAYREGRWTHGINRRTWDNIEAFRAAAGVA